MTDTTAPDPNMATVVITADHVYLPLDENGAGKSIGRWATF